MNYEISEDQKLLKEMTREFAEKEIAPVAKSLEDNHQFPHDLFRKMGNLGILGMSVPPEYEGTKTDSLSFILVLEEISRFLPAIAVITSVHVSLFCHSIVRHGTAQQKKKYLPKAAKGEILGAFCLTEPEAGSDATNIKTKARKHGDAFILNGTKNWVSNGNDADAFILFAYLDGSGKDKKMSAFIADKKTPGLHVTRIEEKMGLHSSPTAEISLEDCRIPLENLLGEEGKGAQIAFQCLDVSRIAIAAQATGLSQRAMEEAVRFAKHREAFGKKIADFQAIQFMIAEMATLIDASRFLTYRAADLNDRGRSFTKESSMAKLFAAEAANKIAYQALQIHGGYGYSKEFFIEQIYRDARVLSIYEGTSEIQRLIIARHLLKDS